MKTFSAHFSISSLFLHLVTGLLRPKYDDFDHLSEAVANSVEVGTSSDLVLETTGLGSVLNSTPLVLVVPWIQYTWSWWCLGLSQGSSSLHRNQLNLSPLSKTVGSTFKGC